jgi:hypothetical protein
MRRTGVVVDFSECLTCAAFLVAKPRRPSSAADRVDGAQPAAAAAQQGARLSAALAPAAGTRSRSMMTGILVGGLAGGLPGSSPSVRAVGNRASSL